MVLELDFENKTITVKGVIKVSELIAKVKELNLDTDWNVITPIEVQRIDYPYPIYPQTNSPYWWELQPYSISESDLYVGTGFVSYNNNTLTIN